MTQPDPQPYQLSEALKARLLRRQGRLFAHESLDAAKTALVVVDMQNYFCAEGHPAEVPASRATVPAINCIAAALRAAGGRVAWVQTSSAKALTLWKRHHDQMMTPDRVQKRIAGLAEGSEGFKLFPALQPQPGDLYAKKVMYSAFIQGSSDLDAQLRAAGIETLLVAGTATNVCCESTARDAMMLDYGVVMLSDGNSASTLGEHQASLDTFALFFGDVMTVGEAIARLRPAR